MRSGPALPGGFGVLPSQSRRPAGVSPAPLTAPCFVRWTRSLFVPPRGEPSARSSAERKNLAVRQKPAPSLRFAVEGAGFGSVFPLCGRIPAHRYDALDFSIFWRSRSTPFNFRKSAISSFVAFDFGPMVTDAITSLKFLNPIARCDTRSLFLTLYPYSSN